MKKKLSIDEAVERASKVFEDLLATLPIEEQHRRRSAFHDAVVAATEEVDIVDEIRNAQGTQTLTAFAATFPCSPGTLSDIYAGNRTAGKKILDRLNLVKQTSYKRRWR